MVDNVGAAYEATKHLIENGSKRIAFLAGPSNVTVSNLRQSGYEKAIKDSGLILDETLVVHGNYNLQQAIELTNELFELKNPPDGLVVVSDRLALGAIAALRKKNIRIPEDVAIVSFNDEPICSIVTPTLSSVAQPTFEMGKMAITLLINQIENPDGIEKPEVKVFKTELKIRESSLRVNK